jgi:starch phosphorylase
MISHTLTTKIPERINRLDELAHNIWWSWHPKARDLFRYLDYPVWRSSGHNPVKVLYDTTPARLQIAAQDPVFLNLYDAVLADFEAEMQSTDTWFSRKHPDLPKGSIAYFSMEFALHNSLPIYAGGLGVLAGDMCKEASDLGLPLVGIGFMYPQGYFHQHVSADGWQQEIYQQLSFNEAPISQMHSARGDRCMAQVELPNRVLSIGVWLVKVGRVNIHLLDTNLEENSVEDRQLSARLYTADPEMRILQEIILGIGGVRVLRQLGIRPHIWHANEGHSAFMSLERIREEVASGQAFEAALQKIQSTTIFTTHTPVPSGHDCFPTELMQKYFADYWPTLGINRERFISLANLTAGAARF